MYYIKTGPLQGGIKPRTSLSEYSMNAYPLGFPFAGPDLWNKKSNFAILPYFVNTCRSVYLINAQVSKHDVGDISVSNLTHPPLGASSRRIAWSSTALEGVVSLQGARVFESGRLKES